MTMAMAMLWAGESAVNFRHFLEFEVDGIDVLETMLLGGWDFTWRLEFRLGKNSNSRKVCSCIYLISHCSGSKGGISACLSVYVPFKFQRRCFAYFAVQSIFYFYGIS